MSIFKAYRAYRERHPGQFAAAENALNEARQNTEDHEENGTMDEILTLINKWHNRETS